MLVMQLEEPWCIGATECPVPEPHPDELLLRTETCGLCASELDVFLGRNPWQTYPALLGHEAVGRVLGAGFMGLLLTQLLRVREPRWLLVAARRADVRTLARELGATHVCPADDVQSSVWQLTGGVGADVVVEATGSERMLAIAASLLRPEGTLAIVGYHQGDGRHVPVHEWNWKALRLANCHFRSEAKVVARARRGLALAAAGDLEAARLVTHRFRLWELQRAFETAADRPTGFVKVVIVADTPAGASLGRDGGL
jgi:L-iditol 2-dehydrogenase